MQPQGAALAIDVQGSKGCPGSPAIQAGVSTALSHPVSGTEGPAPHPCPKVLGTGLFW